ncbi:hypothetical protein OWV82_021038 [Melia azedarach]|uniref:Uncharacterized protein n=1 Tax=Melia azedarach TaxID=155640 RepID=A0ACC1X8K0_MELAZ|nr:hypothetical protein OWV82_021038 [Melia azedarach]
MNYRDHQRSDHQNQHNWRWRLLQQEEEEEEAIRCHLSCDRSPSITWSVPLLPSQISLPRMRYGEMAQQQRNASSLLD